MIWHRAISLVNARVVTERGVADTLRFASHIVAIGDQPEPGDAVVDAMGGFVLPGLVNAHDHLELNHFGRLKFRERYCNASEWIDDMRPRLSDDRGIRAARGRPLSDRLFVGALKNLVSGVTTVAHHNPFYRELRGMPVRVLRRYGWAHSFSLEGQPAGARGERGGGVQDRFRSTASDRPFFVHLAEGIDAAAHDELRRLHELGCLGPNTVIVHGVALDRGDWRRVALAGASLVWCPASNLYLFGQTIDPAQATAWGTTNRIALGTDSRLTGSRDLLDELRIACESSTVPRSSLLGMVTTAAAQVIRQPQLGCIRRGAPADLIVVPGADGEAIDALLATSRRDVDLVTVAGRPMIARAAFAAVFDRRGYEQIEIDGTRKLADVALARRIAACSIAEPGVAAA